MNLNESLTALQRALDEGGLRAGLELLNKRVPHRFTVVYRFDGQAFYGVIVVDKQNDPPDLFNKVPFVDSFCRYTVDEGVFKTADSVRDCRLDGHIHQANVQSYIGLPLTDGVGDLYGTFCHLDFVPHEISEDEFAFMQKAAWRLAKYVPATRTLAGA
jgi:GAF domain-containing protein